MSREMSQDPTMSTIESLEQSRSVYSHESKTYRGLATLHSISALAAGYAFVDAVTDSTDTKDISKNVLFGIVTFGFSWAANAFQGKANTAEQSAAGINVEIARQQAEQA